MTANGIPIDDDNRATVPMEATAPEPLERIPDTSRSRKRKRKGSRAVWGAGFLAALIVIGGVAWNLLPRISNSDSGDEIAEIDGFESDEPSFGAPVPDDLISSRSQTGNAIAPPALADEIRIPPRNGTNPVATIGTRPSATAWLTGTIEDMDSVDRIGVPERISGGPSDKTNFR